MRRQHGAEMPGRRRATGAVAAVGLVALAGCAGAGDRAEVPAHRPLCVVLEPHARAPIRVERPNPGASELVVIVPAHEFTGHPVVRTDRSREVPPVEIRQYPDWSSTYLPSEQEKAACTPFREPTRRAYWYLLPDGDVTVGWRDAPEASAGPHAPGPRRDTSARTRP